MLFFFFLSFFFFFFMHKNSSFFPQFPPPQYMMTFLKRRSAGESALALEATTRARERFTAAATAAAAAASESPGGWRRRELSGEDLAALLRRRGLPVQRSLPASSGFALPEWHVVTALQRFAAFLTTRPWYRYPFLRALALYWSLAYQEFCHAKRTVGLAAAMTGGLTMTVVIGTVLSVAFAQLQVLALPLILLFGTETAYGSAQIVVRVSPRPATDVDNDIDEDDDDHDGVDDDGDAIAADSEGRWWRRCVHPGISRASCLDDDADPSIRHRTRLVALDLPRHAAFTGVLAALAASDPRAELVSISGCTGEVHVLLAASSATDFTGSSVLGGLPGLRVLFSFRHVEGTEVALGLDDAADRTIRVAVGVAPCALLELLRAAADAGGAFRVVQVFGPEPRDV
jgi:hypothetical protein